VLSRQRGTVRRFRLADRRRRRRRAASEAIDYEENSFVGWWWSLWVKLIRQFRIPEEMVRARQRAETLLLNVWMWYLGGLVAPPSGRRPSWWSDHVCDYRQRRLTGFMSCVRRHVNMGMLMLMCVERFDSCCSRRLSHCVHAICLPVWCAVFPTLPRRATLRFRCSRTQTRRKY